MKKKVLETVRKHIDEDIVLENPKERKFGHFATPIAFALAKKWRKNPMLIAQELATDLEGSDLFEKVDPIKGYVNLKLSRAFLSDYAKEVIQNPADFGKDSAGESILLEFVSANPTGPLHIGHARGAVWGDVFARVGTHLGYALSKEYYLNDAGKQVLLLGESIACMAKEQLGIAYELPQEYYRGEYIHQAAKDAITHFGKDFFAQNADLDRLSSWGVEYMLGIIKDNMAEAGIVFDSFVSEKKLYEKWDAVFDALQESGAVYESQGKQWLRSQQKGDELDRVVVRDNKMPTYLAGDIIYHDDKFKRGYDRCINIWGADHHGYIARVKASMEFLGHDPGRLEIILSQMVSLLKDGQPYKMSKRAGNFILMEDVVKEIGSEALRFLFVSKKCDTHLEFDITKIMQQDASNPIFYINYAHARIHSLFQKCGSEFEAVKEASLEQMDQAGLDLLFDALLLPEVLQDAFKHRQLQKITDYLYELASGVHKLYNGTKVHGHPQEEAYLKVFATCACTIHTGMGLLGIEAKKQM
ncbi:MAG: arginine--tRNA ligase [Campylobacterota bacterium]